MKKTLPKYLTTRKLGFYASMEIPKALRPSFQMKARFFQSLETRDQRVAERRLPLVIARWKAQLAAVQGNSDSGLLWEVMEWRKAIDLAPDPETQEALEYVASDWIEKLEDTKGTTVALEAAGVLSGVSHPLKPHLPEWQSSIEHLHEKTRDMMKSCVAEFVDHFKTTSAIDQDSVRAYLAECVTEKAWSSKTASLRLTFIRNFVAYLDEKLKTDLRPLFSTKALPKVSGGAAKTAKKRAWIPLASEDVAKVYEAAMQREDQPLADLIALGAYTGCRIEELCSLKVDHVTKDSIRIEDAKTANGIREIPIHGSIKKLLSRLQDESDDGYVLSGQSENKYGDRSNAIGKRFGRLKESLGFDDRVVFHSVRKTVITQLEQAGVSENVTADLVGHDKPRITYGLYSGGASMKQKKEALALVRYPGLLVRPK